MKSIEYCLNIISAELKNSWDKKERPPLDVTSLLKEFDLPHERHEFFRSSLNKIIDDGFAEFLDDTYNRQAASLDSYQRNIILTAVGYYFKEKGGYRQQLIDKNVENNRLKALENSQLQQGATLNRLTLWISIASGVAGVYYLIQIFKIFC